MLGNGSTMLVDRKKRSNYETDFVFVRRTRMPGECDLSPGIWTDYCEHSASAETRYRDTVGGGRETVPRAHRGTGQQHRQQPGEHAAALVQAGSRQPELRAGGGIVGPVGARGRPLRFRAGGRPHPGSAPQSTETDVPVVWQLEERSVELPSALGQAGLQTVPSDQEIGR